MLARWQARTAADAARIEARGKADALRINAAGQADAISLITRAQAEAKERLLTEGLVITGEVNVSKELESRITFQEQKRQSNIRSVVELAAEELGDKQVKNHEVDHDFVARFFADVQDITSEHMQRIWAKILAGEVETPGRTSLHTLSILKNMSQRDAELFEDVSRFVCFDLILNEKGFTEEIPEFPALSDLITLESYGLIRTGRDLERIQEIGPEGASVISGEHIYRFSLDSETQEVRIPGQILTPQGRQLHQIINPNINEKYLLSIFYFIKRNWPVKLERSKNMEKFGDEFRVEGWETVCS